MANILSDDRWPHSPDTRAFLCKSAPFFSLCALKTSASSRSRTQSHRCANRKISFNDDSTFSGVNPRSPQVIGKSGLFHFCATASAVAVLPSPGTPWRRITIPRPFPLIRSCVGISIPCDSSFFFLKCDCSRAVYTVQCWVPYKN